MRLAVLLLLAFQLPAASPFVGNWNFNLGQRASWLGITEKGGHLVVWYQPTGGNVYEVQQPQVTGNHLKLTLGKATDKGPRATWELEATGGNLTGQQVRGDNTVALSGTRAPELERPMPKAWANPVALFNGHDLTGWEPIGTAASHWVVKDADLLNEAKGANLRTKDTFQDFKLHFEVNGPDGANSGFYLRGRYELQLEYEPLTMNPPERRIGSIYGRLTPQMDMPRRPGTWEIFDITLVGRTLTVIRNGVLTINARKIEGITGGALDANEAEPGPFYTQGDHTGGLKFRNILVSIPKP